MFFKCSHWLEAMDDPGVLKCQKICIFDDSFCDFGSSMSNQVVQSNMDITLRFITAMGLHHYKNIHVAYDHTHPFNNPEKFSACSVHYSDDKRICLRVCTQAEEFNKFTDLKYPLEFDQDQAPLSISFLNMCRELSATVLHIQTDRQKGYSAFFSIKEGSENINTRIDLMFSTEKLPVVRLNWAKLNIAVGAFTSTYCIMPSITEDHPWSSGYTGSSWSCRSWTRSSGSFPWASSGRVLQRPSMNRRLPWIGQFVDRRRVHRCPFG